MEQEFSVGGADPEYGGEIGENYGPGHYGGGGGGGDEARLPDALPRRSSFSELFMTQLPPEPAAIDTGLAWFFLVFSATFLVLAVVSMAVFVQARNVFEIRARSAYLVMLTGTCFLAVVIMIVKLQVFIIFHLTPDVYTMLTIYYFALVCSTCCYGSRAIRLAVLYSPRARKNMPWLAPERNHLCACVFLGIVAMFVPLYDMYDIDNGPEARKIFVDRSTQHLWKVTIACQCVVVALYPFVRKIEDIFNIMTELRAMMVWKLLVIVGGRVGETYGDRTVSRWVNQDNMGYIGIITMFALSVVWPIHQRLFHPLESSDPKVVQALARRKRSCPVTATSVSSLTVGGSEMSSSSVVNSPDFQYEKRPSTLFSPLWTYEKVVAVPEIAEAFEEFSRKALCQELVMFLKDVTLFQAQRVCCEDADALENGCGVTGNIGGNCGGNGGGNCGGNSGGNSDGNSGGNCGGNCSGNSGGNCGGNSGGEDRSLSFSEIVRKYIVDGGPDEINISSTDKKIILDVYNARNLDSRELSAKERRFVFSRAYAEVRFMLESNLLSRFMSTAAFRQASESAENRSMPPSV